MAKATPALENLIQELSKLPSIGRRSAERLAFHILQMDKARVGVLSDAILRVKTSIVTCSICFNVAESNPCPICADSSRKRDILCVVESESDIMAFEKSAAFKGLYHNLRGRLSPLKGITADDLTVRQLLERLHTGKFKEIIIATNPDVEGDATALYLSKVLQPFNLVVSRIGFGLPIGGSLEYADEMTIKLAIEGRQKLKP